MRIVFFLVVPPLLLLLCALALMWLPLPLPFPPALSGARSRMAAIATGMLGMGYLAALAAYALALFRQAGCALDPALQPPLWTATRYLALGKKYSGLVQGRPVHISFLPSWGITPAQLNVYVGTDSGMRMSIGRRRPLLDCQDCPRVVFDGSSLQVYAEEEAWARRLWAVLGARGALTRLLDGRNLAAGGEIYLQPGRICLHIRPWRSNRAPFSAVLDDMMILAQATERGTDRQDGR